MSSDLFPYICVDDAASAVEWYRTALGATVIGEPISMEDGSIGHAELRLGEARLFLSDPSSPAGVAAPAVGQQASVTLYLVTDKVDELMHRAQAAGAQLDRGPEDTPHGRIGVLHDPFGHRWMLNSPPRSTS